MKLFCTTTNDNGMIHRYTVEISRDVLPSDLEDDLDAGMKVEIETSISYERLGSEMDIENGTKSKE
jgi:hypothetical protein